MKKTVMTALLGLSLSAPHAEAGLKELLTNNNTDIRQRIIFGGGTFSGDPSSLYLQAIHEDKNYEYDKAETLYEKIISYGPANNPAYMKAKDRLVKGHWEDIVNQNLVVIQAERAAADYSLDLAERLPENDPQRLVFVNQAETHANKRRAYENQYKRALKKLGGDNE